jgi:hypothetical protein
MGPDALTRRASPLVALSVVAAFAAARRQRPALMTLRRPRRPAPSAAFPWAASSFGGPSDVGCETAATKSPNGSPTASTA